MHKKMGLEEPSFVFQDDQVLSLPTHSVDLCCQEKKLEEYFLTNNSNKTHFRTMDFTSMQFENVRAIRQTSQYQQESVQA